MRSVFLAFLFSFNVENRFFTYTIHHYCNLLYPSYIPTSLPNISTLLQIHSLRFSLQKRTGHQETITKQDKTKYNRQVKTTHIQAVLCNSIGGKESQEQAEELEIQPPPLVKSQENTKLTAITYMQSICCAHECSVFAASVSVSPCEPCLVFSMGHILLVSFITSYSYKLFSQSSVGFPTSKGEIHQRFAI